MRINLARSLFLAGLFCLPAVRAHLRDEGGAGSGPALVHRTFHEVDTLLANPGQGWMSQSRTPKTNPRFPCSVVYIRFNGADIEPEQGKYNWQLIDDVIAAWKPRGATVAFRVMACNAHSAGYYASPKWLFDAGCKVFEYLVGGDDPTSGGKRIARIEPDYSDPIYLARHGEFLAAFPPEVAPQMERLARLSGARLVLREVAHEAELKRGAALHLEMKWANVGVGKLYYGYALRCWLVNSAGRPGFAADTKADVRQWLPGEHLETAPLEVPASLEPGEYHLVLGLLDPAGVRRPFHLAIDAPEKDGRYTVGQVRIR